MYHMAMKIFKSTCNLLRHYLLLFFVLQLKGQCHENCVKTENVG